MKIMVFAPHAGIWVHAFPEALIAEALQQNGNEIVYVTCERFLKDYCVVMNAYGLGFNASSDEKHKVCKTCTRMSQLTLNEFKFSSVSLNDYLMSNDNETIEKIVDSVTPENLVDYQIEEIPVGRITLYQTLLEYKKNSLAFSPDEWLRVLSEFRNVLRVYFSAQKILTQEKPQVILVYNSLYSINHMVCHLAKGKGIAQYFLHAGGGLGNHFETMIMAKDDGFIYYDALLSAWDEYKELPCTHALLSKVTGHLLSLFQAKSVFSYSPGIDAKNRNIKDYFGIQTHQKVILLAMSSNDERFSSTIVGAFKQPQQVLFDDQLSWIAAMIDYVKKHPELFLIIRVHPREFKNRRDSVVSDNLNTMKDIFTELPDNIRINWPEDEISLYQLAQEIDVCLNAWSSAGKEIAALGIPVVIYSKAMQVYPSDINYCGETWEDYIGLLEKALNEGWNFEWIRKAYRWYAFEYFRTTIDLSDGFKHKEKNLFNRGLHKIQRMVDPLLPFKIEANRRPRRLKSSRLIAEIIENKYASLLDLPDGVDSQQVTEEVETHLLLGELRKIIDVLQGEDQDIKQTPLLNKLTLCMDARVN